MKPIVRKVKPNEILLLHTISCSTFSEAFSEVNTPDDMQLYLQNTMSLERLSEELENPFSEFFFIEVDGKVEGYLKLNYASAQTEIFDENSTEIERIYVSKKNYSKGLGQVLLNTAFEQAALHQSGYIWLGVWEHNTKAIAFYHRNGFVKFGEHPFMLGNDKQTDILMKCKIYSQKSG